MENYSVINTQSCPEVIKFELDHKLVDELHRLDYERISRRQCISSMINDDSFNPNNESFSRYHDEYVKYNSRYLDLQNEISRKYTPEELKGTSCKWVIDYSEYTITFTPTAQS